MPWQSVSIRPKIPQTSAHASAERFENGRQRASASASENRAEEEEAEERTKALRRLCRRRKRDSAIVSTVECKCIETVNFVLQCNFVVSIFFSLLPSPAHSLRLCRPRRLSLARPRSAVSLAERTGEALAGVMYTVNCAARESL